MPMLLHSVVTLLHQSPGDGAVIEEQELCVMQAVSPSHQANANISSICSSRSLGPCATESHYMRMVRIRHDMQLDIPTTPVGFYYWRCSMRPKPCTGAVGAPGGDPEMVTCACSVC